MIKVILLVDVKNVGKAGQIVSVKSGYAKNYLIPHKLAETATPAAMKNWNVKYNHQLEQRKLMYDKALALKQRLEPLKIEFILKGHKDKVFGAISSKHLVEHLAKTQGIVIDKHNIIEFEPLKEPGAHEIKIKLHPEIIATITVNVIEDEK